jgi:hypothetical protein
MSIRIPSIAAILIIASVARAADYDDPIYSQPAIAKQFRENVQRHLEERLATAEHAQQPDAPAPQTQPAEAPHHPEDAGLLLTKGDPADAYSAYRDQLHDVTTHLAAHAANPSEAFLTCYMAFQAAEKLSARGERSLAKLLYKDSVAALQALQQSAPDWNPAIVTHRIKRADEQIKNLTKPQGE